MFRDLKESFGALWGRSLGFKRDYLKRNVANKARKPPPHAGLYLSYNTAKRVPAVLQHKAIPITTSLAKARSSSTRVSSYASPILASSGIFPKHKPESNP